MSKAFYRKYRSKRLSEVVGQSHITDILSRALADDKVAHAYLFTGPRGVGKTSVARILAHEINQLPYSDDSSHLDIIEIDAASNNGVEDIRDLRDRVQLAPVSAAKKIYIIDEVHMLSRSAFNALLKTLEEPPEHVVFILATTDADKLPATIISRTQRFNFRTIPVSDAVAHLRYIAEEEGFKADDEALRLIAAYGEGSFRDSIGLLDQLHAAAGKKQGITKELVETFLGLPPADLIEQLLDAYEAKDLKTIISLLDNAESCGTQATVLATGLMNSIRTHLGERPQLLSLLDKLLDVSTSSRPDLKLFTVLASSASIKPKTAALTSPSPVLSAPITKLKKPTIETKTVEQPAQPEPSITPRTAVAKVDFDWPKATEHIRTHHVAMYAVLSKCTHFISGNTLTLYTGNGFYKKKLDDSRYRAALVTSLEEIGMGGLTIETIGTPPPPSDEIAASVAALMGGGVEFSLEEAGEKV